MSFYVTRGKGGEQKVNRVNEAAFNLVAFFLVILVVMAPLEPAFAQSTDITGNTGSDSATGGVPVSSSDTQNNSDSGSATSLPVTGSAPERSPSNDSSKTNSTDNKNSKNDSRDRADQRTEGVALLTQGSGSPGSRFVEATFFNQSQFKIDKNTGAARVTYPIVIPPGRNNLRPNLDLVYNSQNSQHGSIFGEGWSLGIPYIERMNKSGVDTLYATGTQKYFASSIDGELTKTTASSSYRARTENGAFNTYTFSGSEWTMTDKNGIQYVFGSTADSKQSDPNNASNTYKWMLKQAMDTNSNTITYAYFQDGGQIYPSSTVYTGNGSSTGIFEVDFLRTPCTDNGTSWATGFAVKSNYRVSEINAKVNGTWVRKYVLGYTKGDNGHTALLSSIAESGKNAFGSVVSLPSSTFAYQTQTPGWTSNPIWNPLISFTATSSVDNGVRLADVNGDGLPDIIQGYTDVGGATSSAAYMNNGAGWTVSSTWNPPVSFSVSSAVNGSDVGVRIADVNGDGLPDIIQAYTDAASSTHYAAYVNNSAGWVASSTWNPPVTFAANGTDTGVRIADVNGDGLPDIVQAYTDSGGTAHYAAYINNGNGWTLNPAWNPPAIFIASSTTDVGTRLADVSGDGLPDIIQAYADFGGGVYSAAYLNNGNGWNASSTSLWNPPVTFAANGTDTGVRIADVNGDGLPDIVQATDSGGTARYVAYLNNGAGWAVASSWNPPITFTLNGADNGVRIVDVNGDGLPDIVQAYTDSLGVSRYAAYINNNMFRADVLTGSTYPQGGSSAISYQSILQITDDLGNVLNGVPYPVYIVSKLTNSDGSQNVATSTYVYYGGTYYTNGPFDHAFAGFTSVEETDGAGNVTKTYYHTSNGTNSARGEYQDNFWKIGKPYRVESYDNATRLYRTAVTAWDSAGLPGNAAFVFPGQTVELDYDGLSTHTDSAESYVYNMANGNQTQKIQWGQVMAEDDGSFTDIGSDKYITSYGYASSTTSSVIGKISDETLTNQSSTKIRETQYFYDNLAFGSVGAGNLTKQLDWKSGNTYVATAQHTYNSYGLITESLDPRSNRTTYVYDSYNLYPATTTNALNQSTGYEYDYSIGKPTQTIDPNGLMFQTFYDGVGRPLQVLQPNQVTTSTQDVKTTYTYVDTSNAVGVHISDYLNGSTTVQVYSYYDGLHRLIQTRKSATGVGIYTVTDQTYNNVGLLQKISLPYFAVGSAKTAATSTAALFATHTYDPLGRVLTVANAVGTVSNTYANWKVTTTDANGNSKDAYRDAYGNLVQVDEHNGSSTYTTNYSYDGLKDLVHMTDANGNIRDFAYDGLGRMVSSTDLHVPTDTTYGIWNYMYDNAGNVTTRTDPKNQIVNFRELYTL